eukprot:6457963-Amphidinium_carterae.1
MEELWEQYAADDAIDGAGVESVWLDEDPFVHMSRVGQRNIGINFGSLLTEFPVEAVVASALDKALTFLPASTVTVAEDSRIACYNMKCVANFRTRNSRSAHYPPNPPEGLLVRHLS